MKTNNEKSIFIIYRSILLIVCICIITFINSCQKEESEPPNQLPTCKIISPNNNEAIPFGSQFTISISAADKDGSIKSVSLLINNVEIKKFSSSPYTLTVDTKNYDPGNYTIKAIAMDDKNDIANSEINISIEALLPDIQTKSISEVNYEKMSVDIICSIVSDGGDPINTAGICWSESSNPSIADNTLNSETKEGDFTLNLSNLEYGKTYYIRAYAKNGKGVGYGQELSFKIPAVKPTIETKNAINILDRSAESGGKITSDGGAPILEKGVVWNTNSNPILTNYKTQDGNGTSEYASLMENLIPNTTYFARAYATNDAGTSYGNEIEFKTEIGTPILSDVNIMDIAVTSSTLESSVLDNGGAEIIEKGFVWSETQNPSINNNKIISSSTGNSFTSNLEKLKPNTVYYVKAFASNSNGVDYSEESDFRTLEVLQSSSWINYDDNEFEDGIFTPIPGYKFAVRFNVPQEFGEKYTVKKIKAYLYPFNPFGETLYDIEIHKSFTSKEDVLGNPFLAPTGNFKTIKSNVKQKNAGWNETSVAYTIDNKKSFLVALELKSDRTFGVAVDLKNNVVNPIRSLIYFPGDKSWIAVNDVYFAIRVYIEDEYDNTSNGRWIEGTVINETNSISSISSKSHSLNELKTLLSNSK